MSTAETAVLVQIVERAEREGDLDALRAHIARQQMGAREIKRLLLTGFISVDIAGAVARGVASYAAEVDQLDAIGEPRGHARAASLAAEVADLGIDDPEDDRDVDAPDGRPL